MKWHKEQISILEDSSAVIEYSSSGGTRTESTEKRTTVDRLLDPFFSLLYREPTLQSISQIFKCIFPLPALEREQRHAVVPFIQVASTRQAKPCKCC